MLETVWAFLLIPVGLGLVGFIEPCSIGASLLFLKSVEGNPPAVKLAQAAVFTATRAVFIGLLGAAAALIGTAFLQFQRGGYILLGALYASIGVVYLTGNAAKLMVSVGPGLSRLSTVRGAAGFRHSASWSGCSNIHAAYQL
jgi:cytochrome c-type biogenesis protein